MFDDIAGDRAGDSGELRARVNLVSRRQSQV